LARGSDLVLRGQYATMRSSFVSLRGGLLFSILLVYLLIVVNFQSWLDPFIIITALPAALAGIVLILFLTHTTLSVPAMMGAIMCMGVATANSILVIAFAKDVLERTGDPVEAALAAGETRFRPVLMTALAMIIGMVPMAMGLGEGGEQNAPRGDRRPDGGDGGNFDFRAGRIQPATPPAAAPRCALIVPRGSMIEEETKQENRKSRQAARMPLVFRLALLVLLAVVAALLYSTIHSGIRSRVQARAALAQATLDQAVPTVQVIRPRASSAAEELVLPGDAQAFVATPIFARVNGYLKKWYSDIGTRVKAGQLLAEIETPEIDQQLDQARADLATAQANYALALTTAERYQNLFKTQSVAKQDVDNKVGDMHAKKAIVDSATSNVRRLLEMQRFQKVYAPFDGVITARNIDIGALIDAGANTPGKELFDLAATDRLRVYVNVPQSYSRSATVGRAAQLALTEMPGRSFSGRIVRTAEAIDPASRTLLTEVDVDNPTGELLPGAFVSVHFHLDSKAGAVVLPVNTLIFRSAGLQVGVVRDGKAILVPVVLGRDFGNTVEVASGVTTADLVIENPSDSLISGTTVRVAAGAPAAKGER